MAGCVRRFQDTIMSHKILRQSGRLKRICQPSMACIDGLDPNNSINASPCLLGLLRGLGISELRARSWLHSTIDERLGSEMAHICWPGIKKRVHLFSFWTIFCCNMDEISGERCLWRNMHARVTVPYLYRHEPCQMWRTRPRESLLPSRENGLCVRDGLGRWCSWGAALAHASILVVLLSNHSAGHELILRRERLDKFPD
jgi:hypothetical protein